MQIKKGLGPGSRCKFWVLCKRMKSFSKLKLSIMPRPNKLDSAVLIVEVQPQLAILQNVKPRHEWRAAVSGWNMDKTDS